jgi:ACR3 family arsenite efflux pump ArsB
VVKIDFTSGITAGRSMVLIFALSYGLARLLKLSYADAAPAGMIGASNHFEVAIATAAMLAAPLLWRPPAGTQ